MLTGPQLVARFRAADAEVGDRLQCIVSSWNAEHSLGTVLARVFDLDTVEWWKESGEFRSKNKKEGPQVFRVYWAGHPDAFVEMEFLAKHAMAWLNAHPSARQQLDHVRARPNLLNSGLATTEVAATWCLICALASASGFLGDALAPAARSARVSRMNRTEIPWQQVTWSRPFRQSAAVLEVLGAANEQLPEDLEVSRNRRVRDQFNQSMKERKGRDQEAIRDRELANRAAQLARPLSYSEAIDQLRAMSSLKGKELASTHEGAGLIILKMVRQGLLTSESEGRAFTLAHDAHPAGPDLLSVWSDFVSAMRRRLGLGDAPYFQSFSEDAAIVADMLAVEVGEAIAKREGTPGPTMLELIRATEDRRTKTPAISETIFRELVRAADIAKTKHGQKGRRFTSTEVGALIDAAMRLGKRDRRRIAESWARFSSAPPETTERPRGLGKTT